MSLTNKGEPVPASTPPTLVVHTEEGLKPVSELGSEPGSEEGKEAKPDAEPPPEPKAEEPPEKKKMAPKPKPKPKPAAKKPSDDAVLSRARRMYRSKMKKVWEALGVEGTFDEARLDEVLEGLVKDREASMGAQERVEARLNKLEEQNSELRAKQQASQAEADKARRELEQERQQRENLEVENQILDEARKVGILDGDYALHLFRKHVQTLPEDQEPDPSGYFEGLKNDDSKRPLPRGGASCRTSFARGRAATAAGQPTRAAPKPNGSTHPHAGADDAAEAGRRRPRHGPTLVQRADGPEVRVPPGLGLRRGGTTR